MHQKQVSDKGLVTGIVFSMFLWGLSWPSGKVLAGYCTAVNFTVYRYILVVATMLLLLPSIRISFRIKRSGIPAFIASGILLAIYSYFFFLGIKKGAAGAGGVLVTTLNPIMAYIIGMVLDRRLPSRNEAAGMLLGISAGAILLKIWDNSALLDSGNLYFLIASFLWATMSKITAGGARYGSSMSFSLWQYVVTLVCLIPFMSVEEMQSAIHIKDPRFWLNLIFGAVIVTALATTVYFYTTTRLGAEKASSFIFLVPLAAAVSSWLFLGERILPHTIAGGVLGMAAVYMINKKRAATVEI